MNALKLLPNGRKSGYNFISFYKKINIYEHRPRYISQLRVSAQLHHNWKPFFVQKFKYFLLKTLYYFCVLQRKGASTTYHCMLWRNTSWYQSVFQNSQIFNILPYLYPILSCRTMADIQCARYKVVLDVHN